MYRTFKRLIDVAASFLAILVLSPLLLIIIVLLSVTGEREVFYFQERVGYRNRRFKIWKFATMVKNSPNIGTGTLTLRNDPRVTRIGRVLRMSKLNELPQLFNVLIGDMSLIGPRPLMVKDFERYSLEIREQIYDVKPGITGIGSVVFRDEELLVSNHPGDKFEYYKNTIMPYKGALELWYKDNVSFKTDMLILFITAWKVISPNSEAIQKVFPGLPSFKGQTMAA